MKNTQLLNGISDYWKQNIYEALTQGMCEDYQASVFPLDLRTNNSRPSLKWDLVFRNLISFCGKEGIPYVILKKGSWSFVLVYDEINDVVISFMRKSRYKQLVKSHGQKNPQYINELLELNRRLQSKQMYLFTECESHGNSQISDKLKEALNELCINFEDRYDTLRHILVVFDYQGNGIQFLRAYLMGKQMEIIEESNWLGSIKPIISNEISEVTDNVAAGNSNVILNKKAFDRIKKRGPNSAVQGINVDTKVDSDIKKDTTS
ncbi:DUF5986 family protein [Mogibacterium timidum]|uniref:DUF5986 family protein n=1 Tax=Mogibacterium timidum TaxID=35519 RepID=UPI0028D3B699|nr:DUF5986 family protein [Mogibacterium timidum]